MFTVGPSAQQYLTLQIVPPPYPPTLSLSPYRDWYLGKQEVARKTVEMNNDDHFECSHFSLIRIIILLMSFSRSGTLTTAIISTTTAPLIDSDQLVRIRLWGRRFFWKVWGSKTTQQCRKCRKIVKGADRKIVLYPPTGYPIASMGN